MQNQFSSFRKDEPVISTNSGKEEMIAHSVNVARKASIPSVSSNISNRTPVTPTPLHPAEPSDLRFNRLRPSIEKSDCKYTRYFGRYVAREAIMDEEYWIAAWLRAEDHYEDQSGDRYVESFKRKFASQEFHALKKRCGRQVGEKYTCFVAVKNDDVTRTVVNSVVGTVDLCVRHPLHGETYPAEPGNTPFYSRIYQPDQPKFGYLTNVCVAKYARRQGIASNMLLLAIDAARLDGKALGLSGIVKPQIIVVHLLIPSPLIVGAESIYIHVHKDNLPARRLYDHVGFKVYIIFFSKKLSFFHLVIKL
ncbi:hypothetical protein CFC21_062967 [Triticum aestivum]|uniref:N-acetyltransferase domain-containing protein n=2 Tax=Triticum aestivum TaxID=4565 RepID=A0A9R1GXA6_WHEAT|nr:hypothetical protein CFC21_062967 [Triticum aestivum]